MADNRKYYYMRLKEDFFDSEEMILLEAMQDGYLYQNILLKLYCRSLKNEGRLMLNGIIPYNSQMLAAITRQQVGVVEKALQMFQELGLIEILDNGAIYMMNIQNYIGSSSTEADRQREYYQIIKDEKGNCKKSYKKSCKKSLREIEIEKDIKIDIEKEKNVPTAHTRFIPPTVDDVRAYCKEINKPIDAEAFINYYQSNGWKVGRNAMKDWKATVRNWYQRDKANGKVYQLKETSYNISDLEQSSMDLYK